MEQPSLSGWEKSCCCFIVSREGGFVSVLPHPCRLACPRKGEKPAVQGVFRTAALPGGLACPGANAFSRARPGSLPDSFSLNQSGSVCATPFPAPLPSRRRRYETDTPVSPFRTASILLAGRGGGWLTLPPPLCWSKKCRGKRPDPAPPWPTGMPAIQKPAPGRLESRQYETLAYFVCQAVAERSRPCRAATISAMIARAISSGDTAPIFRPMGA
jgi:hypothetical protein